MKEGADFKHWGKTASLFSQGYEISARIQKTELPEGESCYGNDEK